MKRGSSNRDFSATSATAKSARPPTHLRAFGSSKLGASYHSSLAVSAAANGISSSSKR